MRCVSSILWLCVALVSTSSPAPAQNKVVFGQASEASFTQLPILVARGLKLFEARGIQAEFITVKSNSTLMAGMIGGDLNVIFTTAAAAIQAKSKKQDARIFASIMGQVNSAVVVQGEVLSKNKLEAGSSLGDRLKVMRGLRLAISSGSANEFILRHMIEHAGLNPDRDVTLVPIGADAMVAAFSNKRIDGFIMASPVTDTAITSFGGRPLVDFLKGEYGPLQGMLYGVFVATDRWLEANPEIAARVARAIWDAQQIIAKDPEKAKQAVASYFSRLEPAVFVTAFNATASSINDQPRISAEGISKNYDFILYSRKEKINVPLADMFTNRFVDAAAKLN
jgi:sulfonate transport system substrate-binding protein